MDETHVALTITPKNRTGKIEVISCEHTEELKVFDWAVMLSERIKANTIGTDHLLQMNGLDWSILSIHSGPENVCGPEGSYTINRKQEVAGEVQL